jgi:hypothetical protein
VSSITTTWAGAASVYDLAINRFFPVLAENGVVPPLEWALKVTPATAAIQFNPNVTSQDSSAMLYAERSFVAADTGCNATFGGDPKLCAAAVRRLTDFYSVPAKLDTRSVADVCRSIPARLIIAKDTDPVWAARDSWVWTEKPIYANGYVRLFGCPQEGRGGFAHR